MLSSMSGGQRVALDVLDSISREHVCHFVLPDEGALLEEIIKRNIGYSLIRLGQYTDKRKNLIDIIKFIFYFPIVLIKIIKVVKKENIDMLYCNGARTFFFSVIVGQFLDLPVIWHIHNYFEDKKIVKLLTIFGSCNKVRKILFVSNDSKSQFIKLNYKSEVLYNCTQQNKLNKEHFYKKTKTKNKIFSIAHIGVVCPAKGQLVFLKAIPIILDSIHNVFFKIIGNINKDEGYYYSLVKFIEEHKISQYVKFLGQQKNMNQQYPLIDITTVNSVVHFESCPLVILESYVYGIPAIGSNIGGTPEIIKDNNTGFVYERGNEKDLAEKIIKLITEPELYKKLSENCKSYSRHFSFENYSRKIRNIVNSV